MSEDNILGNKASLNIGILKNVPMQGDELKFSAVKSSALAFLGDAVYELYVRKYVFESGEAKADFLNKMAVRYVRAESQAVAFDAIYEELDEDEKGVARRGKNHKISSMPHNIDNMTYKKATGFEALMGYLFLEGKSERLEYIIEKAFEAIETSPFYANRYQRILNEIGEKTE